MAIARLTVSPGDGFDPDVQKHVDLVMRKIEPEHGDGWSIQSYDPNSGKLTLARQGAVTQVSRADGGDEYTVTLERGTKPSDGDQVAARLESDPRHDGYVMTRFEPYLAEATLARLSTDARRCRGAVANAVRAKPWDVQVQERPDGGFDVELPPTYQPSKHNNALEEVATTIVGRPGWYLTTDPRAHRVSIIPGELPTFPATVTYPFDQLRSLTTDFTPFGVGLGKPGAAAATLAGIDWKASQFALIGGLPGGGKSVLINDIIEGWLAAGGELAIVTIPDKKSDFAWAKPFVRRNGWGCESELAALATLEMIYEEGKRRSKINESLHAEGWRSIPTDQRYTPILVVVDEVSGLLVTDKLPAGVPKDSPIVQRKIMSNLVKVSTEDCLRRIIAEQRAAGMHVLAASQVTNNNTGVGPSLKALIGNLMLQGARQTKTQRSQAFAAEDRVPTVPAHIADDADAARGVGTAELAGREPIVYKGFFAPTANLADALRTVREPTDVDPEPSAADIARFDPTGETGLDEERPPTRSRSRSTEGFGSSTPTHSELSGAARAAHDAALEQAQAERARRNAAAAAH